MFSICWYHHPPNSLCAAKICLWLIQQKQLWQSAGGGLSWFTPIAKFLHAEKQGWGKSIKVKKSSKVRSSYKLIQEKTLGIYKGDRYTLYSCKMAKVLNLQLHSCVVSSTRMPQLLDLGDINGTSNPIKPSCLRILGGTFTGKLWNILHAVKFNTGF